MQAERRLAAGQAAYNVPVYGRGFESVGLNNGSIRNRATLEAERTQTGHTDVIWALVSSTGWQ